MSQTSTHLIIPNNIDGLEEALESVLVGEDRLVEEIKVKYLHARIRHDYRLQKQKRGHGHAEQIKTELSEKYFNTPTRLRHIERIIYERY